MVALLTADQLGHSLPFYEAFRSEVQVPYPQLFQPGPAGAKHFLRSWDALLSTGIGAVFLALDGTPTGILLATITPDLFDGALVATEHAWYVMPEARGGKAGRELLDAFEEWARERKAARIVMSHFILGMPDLEESFGRRGYVPLEKHYLKAVA